MDYQELLRQATLNLRECAEENVRLRAENARLRADARRGVEFAARVNPRSPRAAALEFPVVVWPDTPFPLTLERLRIWAQLLGLALRRHVEGWPGSALGAFPQDQQSDVALAWCVGWYRLPTRGEGERRIDQGG